MARPTSSSSSRKGAEPPAGRQTRGIEKATINLRLPLEALMRLKVHCALERRTASDVVTDLIEQNLNKHRVVTADDHA
jgi:hypothetical protein